MDDDRPGRQDQFLRWPEVGLEASGLRRRSAAVLLDAGAVHLVGVEHRELASQQERVRRLIARLLVGRGLLDGAVQNDGAAPCPRLHVGGTLLDVDAQGGPLVESSPHPAGEAVLDGVDFQEQRVHPGVCPTSYVAVATGGFSAAPGAPPGEQVLVLDGVDDGGGDLRAKFVVARHGRECCPKMKKTAPVLLEGAVRVSCLVDAEPVM